MVWESETCNIMVTSKCNLNCSFCIAKTSMECKDISIKDHFIAIEDYINNRPNLKQIYWYGGEPLLLPKRLEQYIYLVEKMRPDVTQTLYTNGLNLKMDMIKYLSRLDRLSVSIDGFDNKYRSLSRFSINNSYDAFETLKELSLYKISLDLCSVITIDDLNNPRWYETLIELYQATLHLGFKSVSLTLDNNITKPFSCDQVLNLIYGYKKIYQFIDKMPMVTVILKKFFSNYNCWQCSNSELLDSSAKIIYESDVDKVNEFGCNKLANAIGIDAYNYITKFIEVYRS